MESIIESGFKVYDNGKISDATGFYGNGNNKKGKFKLYCDYDKCSKFIKVKWGGGYGCVTAETGQMCDIRNDVWICVKHMVIRRLE